MNKDIYWYIGWIASYPFRLLWILLLLLIIFTLSIFNLFSYKENKFILDGLVDILDGY